MEIGIISEGYTDQIVIENILRGFLNDKNFSANYLQPQLNIAGNWDKLLKYCKSNEFKQSFQNNDFVVIQIDTDFMRKKDVPKELIIETQNLSIIELTEKFKQLLITQIEDEFYKIYTNQIIFAIAVDSTECWFLPIYFSNKPQIRSKTFNCIDTLNPELTKIEKFYIDKNSKNPTYYDTISRKFLKPKDLRAYSNLHQSFKLFFDELESKIGNQ